MYPPAFGAVGDGIIDADDGPRGAVVAPLAGYAQAGAAAYARAVQLLSERAEANVAGVEAAYPVGYRAEAWCDLGTNLYYQAVAERCRAGTGSGLIPLQAGRAVGAGKAEAAAKVFRFAAHLCPRQVRRCRCRVLAPSSRVLTMCH